MTDETTHIEPAVDEPEILDAAAADEPEVVDGLPVLAAAGEGDDVARAATAGAAPAVVPTRQVAALAATGFMAGAATVAMVHRHRAKSLTKRLSRPKPKRTALGEVVASNSFLVDVHLIRRAD